MTGELYYIIRGSDPEHSKSYLVCNNVNLQMNCCGQDSDNWQLIIMCVLHAICTDYIITPCFRKKHPLILLAI